MVVNYEFDYSEEKDAILRQTRGIGFEEIEQEIRAGKLLDDLDNPNRKSYPRQKIFVVKLKKYVYIVPYVIDKKRQVIFLKTIYPSRKFTKLYMRGRKYD